MQPSSPSGTQPFNVLGGKLMTFVAFVDAMYMYRNMNSFIISSCTYLQVAESRMKRALCDSQTVADLLRHLHLLVTDFPTMQPILTTLCSLITTE